jgi:hypothetical protein
LKVQNILNEPQPRNSVNNNLILPPPRASTVYNEEIRPSDYLRIPNILNEPQPGDNSLTLPFLQYPLQINNSSLRAVEPDFKPKDPELPIRL